MARGSLLQGLENLGNRVKQLERQKMEAVAKAEALERDQRQAAETIEALKRAEQQATARIQELENEKKQAAITIAGLEREAGELGLLVVQASAKVDEILKGGAISDISQPTSARMPKELNSPDQLEGVSAAPRGEPNDRSSKAWRFD